MSNTTTQTPSNEDLLAEESAFYEEHETEFLRDHQGHHLLIKGRELIGSYESEDEAVDEGVRRFGYGPFLVRRAGEAIIKASAPALSLGLLLTESA